MGRKNTTIGLRAEEDWQVESDLRTLMEAEKIEKDQKRMTKVRALAKQKMLDAAAIANGEDSE